MGIHSLIEAEDPKELARWLRERAEQMRRMTKFAAVSKYEAETTAETADRMERAAEIVERSALDKCA